MAEKSVTAILTGWFNTNDGKRTNWREELQAMSDHEKLSLARGICELTGDSIKMSSTVTV